MVLTEKEVGPPPSPHGDWLTHGPDTEDFSAGFVLA